MDLPNRKILISSVILLIAISASAWLLRDNFSFANEGNLESLTVGSIKGEQDTFQIYDNEICEENGKPLVIMFSEPWCQDSAWISEEFIEWANTRDDLQIHYYEISTGDDLLTAEVETMVPDLHIRLFESYSPDPPVVPLYLFGCKYVRGENAFQEEDNVEKEIELFEKFGDLLIGEES